MNMHNISQAGMGPGVGMPGSGVSPMMMQQSSPQQMGNVMSSQPQQPPQQSLPPAEKLDNISSIKSLIGPLKESLARTMKAAAVSLHQNNMTDTIKGSDNASSVPPRFDKHLEEFYSICDQIESHLKTSILCIQQSTSSNQYLPVAVASTRVEPLPHNENGPLSYPQYLNTVRTQIAYAKVIHDTLICAAQNITPNE